MAEIAARVQQWKFDFLSDQARSEYSAVLAAADFLRKHRNTLPPGTLPRNPTQLAVLAIKIYEIFAEPEEGTGGGAEGRRPDREILQAILQAIEKSESCDP
ncbi:MAG TPA: hypothetical protein VGE08_07450 [Steroidobacter sp.]|uniref:hypothetical protein n=1 Tax=Steroidobacter sp. TaxID=1978227 RepID=UPI002EDB3D54